jgi:hypothetical protein
VFVKSRDVLGWVVSIEGKVLVQELVGKDKSSLGNKAIHPFADFVVHEIHEIAYSLMISWRSSSTMGRCMYS